MNEFIDEIKEELRYEKLLKFWNAYQVHLIAGVVIFFISLGGFLYWQHKTEQSRQHEAVLLSQAMTYEREKDYGQAIATLDELISYKGAYIGIAYLIKGGYASKAHATLNKADKKDIPMPEAVYQELVTAKNIDTQLRYAGQLMLAYLQADSAETTEFLPKLQQLVSGNNPWSHLMSELIANMAFAAKDYKQAQVYLESLGRERNIANGIMARREALSQMLPPEYRPVEAADAAQGKEQ